MDQALEVDDEDPASIRTMKEILAKELKDRVSRNDEELLLLAALMNPYTKLLSFLPKEEHRKARGVLLVKVESEVRRVMPASIKEEPKDDAQAQDTGNDPLLPQLLSVGESESEQEKKKVV